MKVVSIHFEQYAKPHKANYAVRKNHGILWGTWVLGTPVEIMEAQGILGFTGHPWIQLWLLEIQAHGSFHVWGFVGISVGISRLTKSSNQLTDC